MNKHLTKYLTHENPSLRNWVKSRILKTDQKYEVIEEDIQYIPEEYQYVCGEVCVSDKGLKSLKKSVLYCESLICFNNQLTNLPELPVCKRLDCSNNQLTQLPELPRCEVLYCFNNQLTQLPNLPICKILICNYNQLTKLPNLPVCKRLVCGDNPGYPFK